MRTMRRGSNGFGIRYSGPKRSSRSPYAVGDDVGLLGHREIGDRAHRGELHRLVDRRRADIERAAKDERKAQHVVDLVRIVRAAGGDDRVGPRRLGEVGHDLGLGIGERQDQRLVRHLREPFGLQHLPRRKAEKDIGARQMMSASVRASVSCA